MPRKRREYTNFPISHNQIQPASLSPKDWKSPSLILERGAKLNFRNEVKIFKQALPQLRSEKQLKAIANLAAKIKLKRHAKLVIAMPAYVGEQNLLAAVRSSLDSANGGGSAAVILFLNASAVTSAKKFQSLLAARKVELEELCASSRGRLQIIDYHFSGSTRMGAIRGLLTDAIALAASNAGIDDLIVISNDADQIECCSNYVKKVIKFFGDNEEVDAGEGLIQWGTALERSKMPELRLVELIINNIDLRPNREFIGSIPAIHAWGANSFFRLSSYCAIGGYKYGMRSSEDADLLQRIEIARMLDTGGFVGFYGRFVRKADSAVVSTDASKLIDSILSGSSLFESLRQFSPSRRSTRNSNLMFSAYSKRRKLIQVSDVLAAKKGNRIAVQKIMNRIIALYRNHEQLKDLGPKELKKFFYSKDGKFLVGNILRQFICE